MADETRASRNDCPGHIVEFWHCSDATINKRKKKKKKKDKSFLINCNLVVEPRDGCSMSAMEKGLDRTQEGLAVTQKGVKLRNTSGCRRHSTVAGEKIQQKNPTGHPNTARLLINNRPMIYRWFISKSNPFVICPRPGQRAFFSCMTADNDRAENC